MAAVEFAGIKIPVLKRLWNGMDDYALDDKEFSTGFEPEKFPQPEDFEYCSPMTRATIPRNEWRDRIADLERHKSSLVHVRERRQLYVSNQNGHPYCWAHGCVRCLTLKRAESGLPNKVFSSTMVGAIAKNYASQGGNTWEAIKVLSTLGVCEAEHWEENSFSRSHDTPGMRKNAQQHIIKEWLEIKSNYFDQVATANLLLEPCAIGLSGHMVCSEVPVWIESKSEYGVVIDNSWSDNYGNRGLAVIPESLCNIFDAYSLQSCTIA